MFLSKLPTLQFPIPLLGKIAFVFNPEDIKEIGINENFCRLATTKCPVTFVRNLIIQKSNELLPIENNNYYHSSLYDNDDKRYLKTEYIEKVLEKRCNKKELHNIRKYININNKDKLREYMLYIVLRRILQNNDIHDLINDIILNINNKNNLEDLCKKVIENNDNVPLIELLFMIKLLYDTVPDYLFDINTSKKNLTQKSPLPFVIRICKNDTIINNILYTKDSYVILMIANAAKELNDYKYVFGTGSNFRYCRFADFFVDLVNRL